MKKVFSICLILLTGCLCSLAQSRAEFIENKGQWPDQVNFKAVLPSGNFWAEAHCFTFSFYDPQVLNYLHPASGPVSDDPVYRSHTYKMHFAESLVPIASGDKQEKHHYNYYIGDDESKWANDCSIYKRFDYQNLYHNIDLAMYSSNASLKYDFIVRPGGNVNDIAMYFEGADVSLEKSETGEELVIKTSVNVIREKAPFAYQVINGQMIEVNCFFRLKNGRLTFDVGDFNVNETLIIDPEIAFSTFIGSQASNFGFTACDDSEGNLISGAAVFDQGYPTTTGAYSADFNDALASYMDIAISKFSVDGSQLLYSTYIGGSGNETPHSVIADSNDNFIVMGATGSEDYPSTTGAYQENFAGGLFLDMMDFFTHHHNDGTDIFVTKFNADGSLSASTFIGGNDNDGLNYADQLSYNYGDAFRGEVNVDANDNVFVASITRSQNFPMEGASTQSAYGGGFFDGVIFKLNPDLTDLMWSSYLGGNGDDACYAIEFRTDGTLVVAGGTKSADFPILPGGSDDSHNGQTDGFIMLINAATFNLMGATFVGTSDYDQVYFVQVDVNNNIYAYGQTSGNMPITAGCYGQANSGQFISKYDFALLNLEWNTTIGTGSGEIDISPTAFLVSDCEQIYISGWGGEVNSNFCSVNPCYAESSTTTGLPVTADAFQSATDGSDFYLCVLTPNATDIHYGSFLGGTESSEHVDGGTSRFDKNGSVYQAVCAGCQNNDDFPTTPGVWSSTNESTGCNIAVFRFDLNAVQAHVEIDGPDEVCIGDPVAFINNTIGATSYQWEFGDGSTSEDFEPTHVFDEPGEYTIKLIGMDDQLCVTSDTAEVNILILPGVSPTLTGDELICFGDVATLTATGSENLNWFAGPGISDPSLPVQNVSPENTTTYTVEDSNECESESLSITVVVSSLVATAGNDVSLCIGENTVLTASGGITYSWSPSTGLNNANIASPTCTPVVTTTYVVTITNEDNCSEDEEVQVTVVNNAPGGEIYDPVNLCEGSSTQLSANDGTSWQWTPSSSLNSGQVQNPVATPSDTTIYSVVITNACGMGTDFVTINVLHPVIEAWGGGMICPGESIGGYASGAVQYFWQPTQFADPFDQDTTRLFPGESTWFEMTGVDENNCHETDSVFVFVYPRVQVDAGPDQYYDYPGSAVLFGNAFDLPFYWWPSANLSCVDCLYPIASPSEPMYYHLAVIDDNGCVSDDSVFVKPYFPVYVPNTVTPDADGINDYFRAYGENIEGFHMRIFDRWGLKIFESYNIEEVWTPSVTGEYYVQNDVYVWVIQYATADRKKEISGHVTVVR